MKKIVFNSDNLTEEEIDFTVNKVRGLVINDKGQALLCRYAGLYLLPGGSMEDGETELEALKREIREETGIEIDENEIEKFLEIHSLNKNYYERRLGSKINRATNTRFYVIQTDKDVDLEGQELTENEKEKGFSLFFTNLSKTEYLVSTNDTDNPKRATFDRELLTVIREFARYKEQENSKEER